jgi:hypothetical protein
MEVTQMKKAANKSAFVLSLLLVILIFSGCQNIFIPANVPVVLRGVSGSGQTFPNQVNIRSYGVVAPGIVQDITNSGNNIILFTAGSTYDIDTYNTDTFQYSSLVNSDKRQTNARYDSFDSGIYYVVELIDPLTNNVGSQILWTDINQSITRIISLPEENVIKYFGIGESGQVVYANNNNQIILSDNEGNRQIYTDFNNYSILAVDYIKDEKGFVFLAFDPRNEEQTNLYYAALKDDNRELNPRLIAENVTDFDVNKITNQVVFIKNGSDGKTIRTWNTKSQESNLIATGNYQSASFTPAGDRVVFTQSGLNHDNESESIWIMNSDGKSPMKLTAPLDLSSQIICHPYKNILFFSVEKRSNSIDSKNDFNQSQIYQLIYEINPPAK